GGESSNDTRACSRTGNGLLLRQLSGDQDDKSPVTGDGYAGMYVPRMVMLRMGLEGWVFPAERVLG
ncbi:MAG: hypothetical protein LC790_21405, partial [Actinobacteria bacterium]|nr:hypothetical protein [Actinomycetota bacterium]